MKASRWILAFLLIGLVASPGMVLAAPDNYIGDTAIYGGSTVDIQPNVLVILDTSGSMADDVPGDPYDASTSYDQATVCSGSACSPNTVYECTNYRNGACSSWSPVVSNVSTVATYCTDRRGNTESVDPQSDLLTTGQFSSSKNVINAADGSCTYDRHGSTYALGNWINWDQLSSSNLRSKMTIAKEVLTNLITDTHGVNFGVMVFDRQNANGGYFITSNGYTTTVKNMEDIFSGTTTNQDELLSIVNNNSLIYAGGYTPLAETLFEAMRYYVGGESAFGWWSGNATSPIAASCQQNYVVIITDGMPTEDDGKISYYSTSIFNQLGQSPDPVNTSCSNGICDSITNSLNDRLPDVAWYMHNTDLSSTYDGDQTVTTYTVGFGLGASDTDAVNLLQQTADAGGGEAFLSDDEQTLSSALQTILGEIFQVDTSFVAPVVPISPENRTYSGDRVYLGFFRPEEDGTWLGNIKKFGLDADGNVVDKNGAAATNSDGSFKSTAVSYWGTTKDGGTVDAGGVGQLLADRANPSPDVTSATTNRLIYTDLTGTSGDVDLTATGNRFVKSNFPDPTVFGLSDATSEANLINYIYGIDVYDDNLNGSKTDNRTWDLGDILHSRPAIVNYNTYDSSYEGSCPDDWSGTGTTYNRTVIYVGSDDGMLHAFRDCDGQELWGFIPDNVLGNLSYLHNSKHTYFVDASPVTYVYDKNGDGIIDPSVDKVVLIFGQRRGGGISTLASSGSRGAYYALDVTVPTAPKLLWKIDNTTSGFSELGETWSRPTLATIKLADGSGGTKEEVVAFFGAGYDNNEDLRYGNTDDYPAAVDTTDTTLDTASTGDVTATVTSGTTQHNPKGRGVYAVKVADLDSDGVPTLATTPTKVWGYTYVDPSTDSTRTAVNNPAHSIPSDIAAVDSNYDGYVDTLYAGDTGGYMWRFNVSSTSTSDWTATRIFSANTDGSGDVGRKIFYKPSVVIEPNYKIIYFGTGDRAHPLNQAVVDRMYALKDIGQNTTEYESNMFDLTNDYLDATTLTSAQLAAIGYSTLSDYKNAVTSGLASTTAGGNYGWYIKLNTNSGEKVLSSPLAYNKVVYYTTYSPNFNSSDPCEPGNLGISRLYALNYLYGTAAMDYDTSNDTSDSPVSASDRSKKIGVGIPSGIVLVFPQSGNTEILVGSGGGLPKADATPGGRFYPLYWLQR